MNNYITLTQLPAILFLNEKKLKAKRAEEEKMEASKNTRSKSRRMSRGLRIMYIAYVFIFVVGGALSIPFVYESQTLWYKTGIDKTMLRVGKIAGLLAAVLLLVQILLGVRGKILEQLFGVRSLVLWHR